MPLKKATSALVVGTSYAASRKVYKSLNMRLAAPDAGTNFSTRPEPFKKPCQAANQAASSASSGTNIPCPGVAEPCSSR